MNLANSLEPIQGVFDKHDGLVEGLMDEVAKNLEFSPAFDRGACFTDAVRNTLGAKLVYIYTNLPNDPVGVEIKHESCQPGDTSINPQNLYRYVQSGVSGLFTLIGAHQLSISNAASGANGNLLIIPLSEAGNPAKELMMVYGLSYGNRVDEYIVLVLSTLYSLLKKPGKDRNRLACGVYDAVKSQYNYVSNAMYEKRFEIFTRSLSGIRVFFEPIAYFDKNYQGIDIWGWEALARTSENKAPADLFDTAELWGMRFQAELDLHILRTAIDTYKKENAKLNRLRNSDTPPLSINVYPDTLMRKRYRDLLKNILKNEKLISGKKIILEVSEKTLLSHETDYDSLESKMEHFTRILKELKHELKVNFAVDDFGVGHSSFSRVASVNPKYIKIDREILYYEPTLGKNIIKQLVDMRHEFGDQAFKIIVEGVELYEKTEDRKKPGLSLNDLINEMNVEYIQGYILSKATSNIYERLPREIASNILDILGWRNDSA